MRLIRGLLLQHGYFFIQDRPPGRLGSGQSGQAEPAEPQVRNPILTSSLEMLMGTGGGASNRGEARLANWSDDGLPPVGFSSEAPGLVAGETTLVLILQLSYCACTSIPSRDAHARELC